MRRTLFSEISKALEKKLVFIGGPRQVGKTTLALDFLNPSSSTHPGYLNWDYFEDQESILKNEIPLQEKIIVFDEIHKFNHWRNFIKGLYDKFHEDHRFLVAGSARLDFFSRGGDSLLGRYRYFRLHPLSLPELGSFSSSDVETLLTLGGFPEPFFSSSESEARIWRKNRSFRVIHEDVRDLQNIKEISDLMKLALFLPNRVGSPLSIENLREDLKVSYPTVTNWLLILEHLYYCFSILPFGVAGLRSLGKMKKFYLWDWAQVSEIGFRFENMVGSHLLKYCHFLEDTQGYEMELRYLRDSSKREIDFIVLKNSKPIFAVECKTGEKNLSPNIEYFKERTSIPAFYQVHLGKKDFGDEKYGRVLPFSVFCKELGLF